MASILLKWKRGFFILLVPAAIGLTELAQANPAATEYIYSQGFYKVLSQVGARATGIFPFSLAQFLVFLLPALLLRYIIISVRRMVRDGPRRKELAAQFSATLLCITGVVWFLFVSMCGLNYQRMSISELDGLEVRPSSAEELAALCGELVAEANAGSLLVARGSDNVMLSSFESYYKAAEFAPSAYEALAADYRVLSGYCPRAKPVILSRGMSVIDLVGVYFPYTFEANFNADVPAYVVPSSILHELAHYKGYMREEEANFLSYLACGASGNADFAYSGAMLALVHASNALYEADRDAYWAVMDSLSDGVRADFNVNSAYWKQFEGPVSEVSNKVNDVYLKTNRQTAGVRSYGQMVDLLLAQYRREHGIYIHIA